MDRLNIPNYSAVLPGTEDVIWVYGGKGPTRSHAKASALMEVIERYSSLSGSCERAFIQGNYLELSKSYRKVIHPDEVVEPVNQESDEKKTISNYLAGFDLLSHEEVLVPAGLALYMHSEIKSPAVSMFPSFHTNGLASGNAIEEAICHALCEVIEIDAVSIADLCASCIPYNILQTIVDSIKRQKALYGFNTTGNTFEDRFVDDPTIFADVELSHISDEYKQVGSLIEKFIEAGIPLLIKDITQKDIGIPTFAASSIEWLSHDYGYFAKGFGAHPDARIALMRAITEVSQTRAVNIQGARDDLRRVQYGQDEEIYKRKWQFMPSLYVTKETYRGSICGAGSNSRRKQYTISLSKIPSCVNRDILDDIKFILKGLKRAGLQRVIIVDLTNPKIGVPVVRAIVPGLETFDVTNSIMGPRARAFFRKLIED
jgi:ribosomal protein S12 methylthiotransferase accessory factor